MITLQKLNVVKIVSSEEEAQKLKAQGFRVIQSASTGKRQKPPGKPPKAPDNKALDGNGQDDLSGKDDEDGASGSDGEDSGGGKE